jgi:hypothetical protein
MITVVKVMNWEGCCSWMKERVRVNVEVGKWAIMCCTSLRVNARRQERQRHVVLVRTCIVALHRAPANAIRQDEQQPPCGLKKACTFPGRPLCNAINGDGQGQCDRHERGYNC